MPQTDAGPVVIVRGVVHALSTAGVQAHPYGTSALPGLIPVLHVLPGTSGDRRCEPASNGNSAAVWSGSVLCSVQVKSTPMAGPGRGQKATGTPRPPANQRYWGVLKKKITNQHV